jgi:hypothetical protein
MRVAFFCAFQFAAVSPGFAGDMAQIILDAVRFPEQPIKGPCIRYNQKAVAGQELFAMEDCPFTTPGEPVVEEVNVQSGASKGRITYPFKCTIERKTYHVGTLKKTDEIKQTGSVKADYIFVFGELTFANIERDGAKICAKPILKKLSPKNEVTVK